MSTSATDPVRDFRLAYALARIGLGVNIALHGLVRLPKLAEFDATLQSQFAQSIVGPTLAHLCALPISLGEAVVGLLVAFGLCLRPALVAGAALMILLITGTCLVENWDVAGLQLIYLAFYCVLLAAIRFNAYAVILPAKTKAPTKPKWDTSA